MRFLALRVDGGHESQNDALGRHAKIAGPESTRVPLMGVKKKFRNHPLMGAGLAMMAIDQLRQNGKRLGKKTAELGWILEDNKATNNIIRSVGGVHYKTHRIYEKALV